MSIVFEILTIERVSPLILSHTLPLNLRASGLLSAVDRAHVLRSDAWRRSTEHPQPRPRCLYRAHLTKTSCLHETCEYTSHAFRVAALGQARPALYINRQSTTSDSEQRLPCANSSASGSSLSMVASIRVRMKLKARLST